MAQPADTYDSYDDDPSVREDLTDIIEDISPTETPFMAMIGRGKAKQMYHQWQIDALAPAVATNAVIEGDDATTDAITPTTALGNYTQISDKVIVLSGTSQVVDLAGKKSQKGYQLMRRSQELKRDMESQMTQNKASVAGDATTARQSASFESWITTCDSRGGGGGAQGGFSAGIVAAPTDGTQRTLTEDLVKTVLGLAWTAGGAPTKLICGQTNKLRISGFTGGSTRMDTGEDKKLTAAIDYYVSDWGEVQVVPDRFSRDRSLLVVDPSLWAVCYLRRFQTKPLAKTGDSDRWQLLVEYTLRSNNEAGSGIVADLTT